MESHALSCYLGVITFAIGNRAWRLMLTIIKTHSRTCASFFRTYLCNGSVYKSVTGCTDVQIVTGMNIGYDTDLCTYSL